MFVQTGALCQWTTDSQRLILEHFDTINVSPSHIWSSALNFSPSSSWVHQYYSAELSQEVKVVKGFSAGWGVCFRTVLVENRVCSLACWEDTVAVGLQSDIIILNAVTGSKITVLSGHTDHVPSLAFLPDGTSLVSGSRDKTIKLWDMQTGGVVKTFQGHTGSVSSVSISPNCTTIASASMDRTIHLWDIQTGECHCIIQQERSVRYVCFFPLDPQHFISISNNKVQEWNIYGHKIASEYNGIHIVFSFDGTKFVLCNKGFIQVQSSNSRAVVAKFGIKNSSIHCCCFSPDGRLVAISDDNIVYVWDITSPEPCLIMTFVSHAQSITSLVFSSPTSLISGHGDSVNFWQIGTSSISPDVADPKSILHTSPIESTTLQAKDGIAISSDSDGVVKIWDLSTGLCKASFQTPAKGPCPRDVQLIGNRLVLVWYAAEKIHILDVEKGELLQTVDAVLRWVNVYDLRISGDGSKVFCMENGCIYAWYIWTGELMGKVNSHHNHYFSVEPILTMDGSKVWVNVPGQNIQGWDFGVPDSSSIKYYGEPPNRPHLDFIGGIRKKKSILPGIENTITGKELFKLPLRYTKPNDAQWDGQYLVAGYDTGEVLILDCNCILAH